jgi:integrase
MSDPKTKTKPKLKRPAAIDLGDLHVSIVRGPNVEGRWYWRARDADRATVWTGWATRDEAAREGAAILARPKPNPAQRGVKTVGELVTAWITVQDARLDIKPGTHKSNQLRVQRLRRHLNETPITAIRRDTLESFVNARIAEGAAIRTVRSDLVSLRHAWRVGMERGLVTVGVLPTLHLRINEKAYVYNHHTPTPDEVARVVAKLPPESAFVVQFLAATGARIGELIALRRDQIDPSKGVIHLNGKTGPRDFPLTEGLIKLLGDRQDQSNMPLIHLGVEDIRRTVREHIQIACRQADVAPFSPHALRRMAVDRMARAGVEPAVAASITGHDPVVMLKHYRVVTDADLRTAAEGADLGYTLRLVQSMSAQSIFPQP